MINGYEKASREVIPATRVMVARQLKQKYNLTEDKIARILGVAQAAVSKYLNDNYSEDVEKTIKKISVSEINKHIGKIASGDKKELNECICTICSTLNKFECRFSSVNPAK